MGQIVIQCIQNREILGFSSCVNVRDFPSCFGENGVQVANFTSSDVSWRAKSYLIIITWSKTLDLYLAKFESRPKLLEGFYLVVVFNGEMVLLLRDNGQNHNLLIECDTIGANNPFHTIRIDSKMVMQVKYLRWKFSGNQTILIDRFMVEVFLDVYNWLFGLTIGNAIFIFQTCFSAKKLFDFLLSFLILCNNKSHGLGYLFMYVNCILCSKILKQDELSMIGNGTNLNCQRMTFLLIMPM
ncbi:hypothetical protein PVL29_025391 [Vitis rotundifolia]|uniref:Uncharacterized protein n=1 Tax=Vitis rotundifolia TaxID=103349 RepID=A0AA38YJP3_VITRO|nr:hypothetical protein PVL29_025391 [Vitis rotundifolia]